MKKHRLDPLLRPTSVAIVGASERADTIGNWALTNLRKGGYKGRVHLVNPNYKTVLLSVHRRPSGSAATRHICCQRYAH